MDDPEGPGPRSPVRILTVDDLLALAVSLRPQGGRDLAYTRMTPTIGRLDLAQKEGKVLGEIERV